MRTVGVDLGERSYRIFVGPNSSEKLENCINLPRPASQVAIIADQTVGDLHIQKLLNPLGAAPFVLTFPPGEGSKSLGTVEQLSEQLAGLRADRDAVLVAFGGGVAGDLAGFVAATWLRGVRFVQVPTTMLAAVDASVGGKTGVNLAAGKNLVGAFHQPQAVIIDTDFFRTLPRRDIASGLAESVKHALIRDPAFLDWHEANAERILAMDDAILSDLVARNCEIKAGVVSQDEREAGLRAILNYGHTIGHALEHLLGYELRHGECVGLGMLVENELAVRRGWLDAETATRAKSLIERLGLPVLLPRPVDGPAVWEACQVDKKVRDGAVNFVLLRALGQPERVKDVTAAEVVEAMGIVTA